MNDIERRSHRGMSQMAPDVFQKIMADTGPKLESEAWLMEEDHKKTRSFWMRAAQTAAVLAACCMLLLGITVYQFSFKVDSVVEIDVNPSLELQVNRSDRVVRVNALNADGVKILDDLRDDLNYRKLNVAVQMLVDTMVVDGYLDQEKNSVLVSVDHGDAEKSAKIQMLVADNVREALGQDEITPVVYHQSYTLDSIITEMSEKYEISPGKAAFIQKLLIKRPDLDMDTLARMTISEITELLSQEEVDVTEYVARNKKHTESKEKPTADISDRNLWMAKAERLSKEREEYTWIKKEDVREEELTAPETSIVLPDSEENLSSDGVIVDDKLTGGFQTGTDTNGTEQEKPDQLPDPDQEEKPDGEPSEDEEQPDIDNEEDDPNGNGQLGSDDEEQETQPWENVEGIPTILHTQIQSLKDITDRLLICISDYQKLKEELGEQEAYATCARYLEEGKLAYDQVFQTAEDMRSSGAIQEASYQQCQRLLTQAKDRLFMAEKSLLFHKPEEKPKGMICPDGE